MISYPVPRVQLIFRLSVFHVFKVEGSLRRCRSQRRQENGLVDCLPCEKVFLVRSSETNPGPGYRPGSPTTAFARSHGWSRRWRLRCFSHSKSIGLTPRRVSARSPVYTHCPPHWIPTRRQSVCFQPTTPFKLPAVCAALNANLVAVLR
jgi:hypothetical protein